MFETEMNIFSEKNICWDQRRAVFSWAAFFPFFPMQTLSNDAEERAAVLRAHDLFIAARDGAEPPASTEAPQPKVWKMEGRGFMLTYNKKKWSCALPELFAKFLVFFKQLVATLGISKWTATIEKSLNSKDEGRVHMHAYVEWAKTTVENLDERFDFESQRP